jgi:glycosyltransferase involved in cell wall biosynthesis
VRILHLAAPAGVGGLERVVHGLAAGQARAGHTVRVGLVVTEVAPVQHWATSLAAEGVAAELLVVGSRAYARERAEVSRLCRDFGPDVVHTHGFRPDVVNAGVVRRAGIPCLTTMHGTTGSSARARLYEWLQIRRARHLDAVLAVSRPLGERLVRAGVPIERLYVVPNAWVGGTPVLERGRARQALGLADHRSWIGWVGRLSREKGCDVLLEALALLPDLPLSAAVVGDGPEREALLKQARRLGIEDRVRWLGSLPGADAYYSAFDVWALSSRTEGTPIALFEAMSAGVPIVAARVGGVPDVVGPEEALLVAPEDPPALAAALRAVHTRADAARLRSERARARLHTDFRAEPWLTRHEGIYQALLRTTPATA